MLQQRNQETKKTLSLLISEISVTGGAQESDAATYLLLAAECVYCVLF